MFRKLWKQIKIIATILIIGLSIPHSLFPRKTNVIEDLDYYMRLNETEKRLWEYKDDKEALALKLEQLELINTSRRKFNSPGLKLDILASRVANKISREAAVNNFAGHWNLAGEKPYHRYAFAGGHDHVTENAYAEWSSAALDNSSMAISNLMKNAHVAFMSEKAPADGHKRTVIDKTHNYVGIGYYISGTQFRYYEEYIDRYFEFQNIPTSLDINEKGIIRLKTDGRMFLYFMTVYYEEYPQPMSKAEIARKNSYQDYTSQVYLTKPAWELSRYRNGNYYDIPVTFGKKGLYYIHLFTDKKEMTKPVSINTKGNTPYSGIVIRVN